MEREEVASYVKTSRRNAKRFISPNGLWAKIRGGKIVEVQNGCPNADLYASQKPIYLKLDINAKDGSLGGQLVVKYSIADLDLYFKALAGYENSFDVLSAQLSEELNAGLVPYGKKYTVDSVKGDGDIFDAEIQGVMGKTFRQMGMFVYKTFPIWGSVKDNVPEKEIDEVVNEKVGEKFNSVKNTLEGLVRNLNEVEGRVRAYEVKDLEKRIQEVYPKFGELEKSTNQNQNRLDTLMTEVGQLKGELIQYIKETREIISVLTEQQTDRPDINKYLHDGGIKIVTNQPEIYNADGKGTAFIEVLTKEGLLLYEKITDPRVVFDGQVLQCLAERARKKVFGGS